MDLELARLAPHPEVPVRRQIAAWLASGIRDGEVAAGERLPSVRRLAALVGVHRNTVWKAYGELARQGLVLPVLGSGVYAAGGALGSLRHAGSAGGWGDPADAGHGLARETAARPGTRRRTRRDPGQPLAPRPLILVEEGDGLRAALTAELRRELAGTGVAIREIPLSRVLARAGGNGFRSHLVVGLPSTCRRLTSRLRLEEPPVPLRLRGGRAELRLVARLERPAVVAVFTASRRVRRFARELLAGWEGIGVASPPPEKPAAVARALRVADLAFADASYGRPAGDGARPLSLRCIRSDSLARIAVRAGVALGDRSDRCGRRLRRPRRTRSSTPG